MHNKLLQILMEYRCPKDRMRKILKTLLLINEKYRNTLIILNDQYQLIYNMHAYEPYVYRTGGSIVKIPDDNMEYKNPYLKKWESFARDYLFVMHVIPYFNEGLNEKERWVIIKRYMKSLCTMTNQKERFSDEKTLLNIAEEKLIELLHCDYYGHQDKDTPGSILWKNTIDKRRTERTGISGGYVTKEIE